MKQKHSAGTPIAVLIDVASEMRPITAVNNAPPTIAMTRNDEPLFVCSPSPRKLSEKIVGNMMDMKKLTATRAYRPAVPPATAAIAAKHAPHAANSAINPAAA